MAVSKKDLAGKVALTAGLTKAAAGAAVDALFAEVSASLRNHDDVDIHGFGKFVVTFRESRKGRNPATGETITLPAKVTVKFKASKTLKDAVDQ